MKECTCKFCKKQFIPRPQTRNPTACDNPECQRKRQRQNEIDWHEQNKNLYGLEYHRIKKQQRLKTLIDLRKIFMKAIKAGMELLGIRLNFDCLNLCIQKFFVNLGIRSVNKLWNS